MSKLFALYSNEITKTIRKISTIVILSLIIVSCFLFPLLVKVAESLFTMDTWIETSNSSLETEKEDYEMSLKEINDQLFQLDGNEEYIGQISELNEQKNSLEDEIETINLYLESGYTEYAYDDFIVQAIGSLRTFRLNIRELENVPSELRDAQWTETSQFFQDGIDLIYALPETKNFEAFIDMKKQYMDFDAFSYMTDMEKQIASESLDLWYQIDPSGGTDGKYDYNDVNSTLENITSLKTELYNEVSIEYTWNGETFSALTPEKKENLENSIAILEHRIETKNLVIGTDSMLSSTGKSLAISAGSFLAAMLLLIVAGSSVSQEIATGSIKSLIIAPVRRWKIFLAKLLSVLTLGVFSLLILFVFSNISMSLIFGTDTMVSYVYASHGVVHSIPYLLYDVLSLFVGNVDLLVYLVLAFMLSIISRNTALSVGLSIGTIFSGSTAVGILSALPIGRRLWMDFLPFTNFNLAADVFPFSSYMLSPEMGMMMNTASTARPGLLFSCVYLSVLIICMLYIGFDSFTRRDIK